MSGTDYEDTPEVRRLLSDLAPTRARQQQLVDLHADTLRTSAAGYILKHGHDDYGDEVFTDWVRSDVDQIPHLAPSDREWLVGLGLHMVWDALRSERVSRRREHWDDVRSRWERAFSSPDIRFDFDTGWWLLLEQAAERVANMHPAAWQSRIVGGKEKMGCLVLHIDYDRSVPGARSEVERLREEIRLASLSMCQVCGGAGRLRLGGFAATLCNRHARMVGALREDDGLHADPWRWADEVRQGDDPERGTSAAVDSVMDIELRRAGEDSD